MNCWSLLDSLVCLARPLLHQDIRHCMSDCPRHFVSPKESHLVNGTHACCQHELPETSAVEPVLFVSLKNFVLACCFIKSPGILVVTVAVNGRLIHYQNNRAGAQSVPLRKCLHEKTSQELNSWSGQTPWKRI
ncbi:hypothetical protein FOYG_16545 [Fusarium oxysporum NRRL 32931]|jgi:hypothetical protein|uniref:Uncharacterized protein n=3 Tax=Fusarium oxysporum TaxID=5507 RepID=W9HI21_FUSOX|nr:hypothetical protein FOYG_16545 [Fusarium oxysporum NRRL 32931]KAJ0150512.1 Uncharacterized protein HZ326_6913 [Fusarium oxysporum f. sp. albedinis]